MVQYRISSPLSSCCTAVCNIAAKGGAGCWQQQRYKRVQKILNLQQAKLNGLMAYREISFKLVCNNVQLAARLARCAYNFQETDK